MKTSYEHVRVEIETDLAYLTIDRPPANAYHFDLLSDLASAVEKINAIPIIKAVIIRSALNNFFSAGADIKIYAAKTISENKQMVAAARKVAELISTSSKIFVAAIQGHTIGGGLELAMACDFRVASEGHYQLGLPEIKLGLIPGNGGTIRLIQLLGVSRALEILMTGDSIDVLKARDLGLVHHIFPTDQFESDLHSFVQKICDGPQQAMAAIKSICREAWALDLEEALKLEEAHVETLYGTADAVEGLKAFVQKRKPNFRSPK